MSDLISRSYLVGGYDVRKVTEYDESGCGVDYKAVPVDVINQAPAVDAIEVVRCKDCIHCGRSPFGYSPTMGWCKLRGEHRRYDYFCASGAKMDGEVNA